MGTARLGSLQVQLSMKQLPLIPNSRFPQEHGGSLLDGKRRSRRPLSHKKPIHLTLRSDFAYGPRSLMRHRPLIKGIIAKAARKFHVRIYETGWASNHIHLLVRGKSRIGLQNFFRVVAGHIAQKILQEFPITKNEREWRGGARHLRANKPAADAGGALKTETRRTGENKFWQYRIYSKVLTWGRQYIQTKKYLVQNTLEALGIIAYKPRKHRKNKILDSS
jgi:REP element-mobilizing transposase RayT